MASGLDFKGYDSLKGMRSYLGISGSTYDAFLSQTIEALSEIVDQWTGRDFADIELGCAFGTHSVSQTFYIENDNGVLLREWPINQVLSVKHIGETLATTAFLTQPSDGWIQFIAEDSLPMARWGKIEVNYVAGYERIPASVRLFVRRGASYLWQRRMSEGIGADLIADTQVTYRAPDDELRNIFKETAAQFTLDVMWAERNEVL